MDHSPMEGNQAIVPDISGHLSLQQGFCYPNWSALCEIVEKNVPESEWNFAWGEIARKWIGRMRDGLGGKYHVYETANFLILSEAPLRILKDAGRSFEDSLKRIVSGLEGIALEESSGKRVVMMFTDIDDYYGYIAHFYPEGEHPMSGGVCLGNAGYVHFAFPTPDYSAYRTILVHELTHGCLGHLPIPTWLNEALAMRMEELICGTHVFHLDQEIFDKHVAHWNEKTIQQFWTGESWQIPGDGFDLSYNLAQVLWRKIEVDLGAPRTGIFRFLGDAHWDDAGEAACQANFDLGLGDLVSDFLGDGPWMPTPQKWPKMREDTVAPRRFATFGRQPGPLQISTSWTRSHSRMA